MKVVKIAGIALGTLALAMVLIGGYLGFVPGVSRVFGSNKPRDLGVELSAEKAYEGAAALGVPATPSALQAIVDDPESARRFDAELTSAQASSMLLIGQDGIPNWPLNLVQIRFSGDGTAEASGIIDSSQAVPFMLSAGVSQANADRVASAIKLAGRMSFYVNGSCSVDNNNVNLTLSQVQVGRLNVPASWYRGNESKGTPYITNLLGNNGFMVESLAISDGSVALKGTRPLSSYEPWLKLVGTETAEVN